MVVVFRVELVEIVEVVEIVVEDVIRGWSVRCWCFRSRGPGSGRVQLQWRGRVYRRRCKWLSKWSTMKRFVYINDLDHSGGQHCSNKISNTKYNIFNFIPKNLWEQFRYLRNPFFPFCSLKCRSWPVLAVKFVVFSEFSHLAISPRGLITFWGETRC